MKREEELKAIIRDCLKELDRSQRPSYAWQMRAKAALLPTPTPEAEPVAWAHAKEAESTLDELAEAGAIESIKFSRSNGAEGTLTVKHVWTPETDGVKWKDVPADLKKAAESYFRKIPSVGRITTGKLTSDVYYGYQVEWAFVAGVLSATKPEATEGISDGNNVPDYIVQASLDKARQVLEATEGGAHEKGIEPLTKTQIETLANNIHNVNEYAYTVECLTHHLSRAALNAKPEQTEHVDTDVLENSASLNTSQTDGREG